MKIRIDFLDSLIDFSISNIYSFEIENKKYLYRISSLFYLLNNGNVLDEVTCFDENNNEVTINNKIRMFSDYFDFSFNSKKYNNDINKYVVSNIEQYNSENILKAYSKLCILLNKELQDLDLPITVSQEEGLENLIKFFKLVVNQKQELLDNLLLIIDLEVALNYNKILCFINLKQYLTYEELLEFYKYATYNSIKIIMIDHEKQEHVNNYEKIIIIDQNLEETMI